MLSTLNNSRSRNPDDERLPSQTADLSTLNNSRKPALNNSRICSDRSAESPYWHGFQSRNDISSYMLSLPICLPICRSQTLWINHPISAQARGTLRVPPAKPAPPPKTQNTPQPSAGGRPGLRPWTAPKLPSINPDSKFNVQKGSREKKRVVSLGAGGKNAL